jgi:hypothetical protein
MDLWSAALLFGAGTIGGVVNAIAGGATLITFPAMLAMGLPPVVANASNAVAISPGHIVAAIADRHKLPTSRRRLLALNLAALIGGTLGALLLLAIPATWFTAPVPLLILFATLLFSAAPRIQSWAEERRADRARGSGDGALLLGVASVYGGFFGAGLGIILTAVLAITEPNDIRAVKALKNLTAGSVSVAAIVIFIASGIVAWPPTSVMLVGALLGGFVGGRLIRVLPAIWVRNTVIVSGLAMSAVYAWKYWF